MNDFFGNIIKELIRDHFKKFIDSLEENTVYSSKEILEKYNEFKNFK